MLKNFSFKRKNKITAQKGRPNLATNKKKERERERERERRNGSKNYHV